MKILIRFPGDNDFGHALRSFGNLLLPAVEAELTDLTPATIMRWFNTIAPTLCEMNGYPVKEGYLKIEEKDVYIDEAANIKLKDVASWGNHDSVLIDGSAHVRLPVMTI